MDKHDNVLYYNENRMIDDPRFMLTRLNRNWDLIIREIDIHDEGSYRCVANTAPIKLKFYQLTVYGKLPASTAAAPSAPSSSAEIQLFFTLMYY